MTYAEYRKVQLDRARATNTCQSCFKAQAISGATRCLECKIKGNDRAESKRRQFREAGLCIVCGGSREDEGRLMCRHCRALARNRYESRSEVVCRRCGKRPPTEGMKSCLVCRMAESRRRSA